MANRLQTLLPMLRRHPRPDDEGGDGRPNTYLSTTRTTRRERYIATQLHGDLGGGIHPPPPNDVQEADNATTEATKGGAHQRRR